MQSISQIFAVAANAGFSGNDLSTAVAVALAESGGNETAYNPETAARGGTPQGQGSYGLWQIYLKAHPQFSPAQLYDPQGNASAAYSIYAAAGYTFAPWSTYTQGAYLSFVPQVLAAVGPPATDQTATDSSGDGSGDGPTSLGSFASGLFSPTGLMIEGALFLLLYLRERGD